MIEEKAAGGMKPQVAVVDDDAENCQVLSELLAAEGFDPLAFETGEAAWSAMLSGRIRPDVVVLDVRMPGLSGVDLLRRIKARFPAIPVILVSAFADEQVWLEGLEAGAADVFPKPIHGASLVRALRAVVGRGQAHGLPVGENPDPHPAGITLRRRDT
jgi:DNA-binding response OmpR family regulator